MSERLPGFARIDRQIMGRMLGNTVRYALIHSADDPKLTEQVQKLVSELRLVLPLEPLAVLIDDLRARITRHMPGPERNELRWDKLLALLVRCHRAQDRRRKQERSAPPSASYVRMSDFVYVAFELRYYLLYHAIRYAFGDPTLTTSATCDWLRNIAPELSRLDRKMIANDIECYLEKPRTNDAMRNDHHWRETLEFLSSLDRVVVPQKRKPRRRP